MSLLGGLGERSPFIHRFNLRNIKDKFLKGLKGGRTLHQFIETTMGVVVGDPRDNTPECFSLKGEE